MLTISKISLNLTTMSDCPGKGFSFLTTKTNFVSNNVVLTDYRSYYSDRWYASCAWKGIRGNELDLPWNELFWVVQFLTANQLERWMR